MRLPSVIPCKTCICHSILSSYKPYPCMYNCQVAMELKFKTFLLVLLLLTPLPSSLGLAEGFREKMHSTHHLLYKDGIKVESRKLLWHEFVLDYDEAGPNLKHTKKPGKGR